jgi:uncharacterized protein (DUF58 family)
MFGWSRRKPQAPAPAAAPAAAAAADPERLLRQLEWTVLRRLDGILQGDYRTLFRGFGLDFADLREYQLNDDVRHMDWNVTARMQVPYVREFQEDREVAAWFVLDLSRSLDFGSRRFRKREVSTALVAVLARLFIRYGNRVGAVLMSDGAGEVVPARSGRLHVLHLLDRMRKIGASTAPSIAVTDLAALIAGASPTIKRRSVVFVVSDFISSPGWGRRLADLARRHEVVAIRLYDSLEMALPNLGMVVLQDAETGEQMMVDTHDAAFRRRFALAADRRETELRLALAGAGVDCMELSTDEPIDAALLRFTRMRKRRSQLAAGGVPAALAGQAA